MSPGADRPASAVPSLAFRPGHVCMNSQSPVRRWPRRVRVLTAERSTTVATKGGKRKNVDKQTGRVKRSTGEGRGSGRGRGEEDGEKEKKRKREVERKDQETEVKVDGENDRKGKEEEEEEKKRRMEGKKKRSERNRVQQPMLKLCRM